MCSADEHDQELSCAGRSFPGSESVLAHLDVLYAGRQRLQLLHHTDTRGRACRLEFGAALWGYREVHRTAAGRQRERGQAGAHRSELAERMKM